MSVTPAANVFELAARQKADQKPLVFKGKRIGNLAQVQASLAQTSKVEGLNDAENRALVAKLEAFYFFGFNFAQLAPDQDLELIQAPHTVKLENPELGRPLPEGILPSVSIGLNGKIKQDPSVADRKDPYLVFKFIYRDGSGGEYELGYFHTLYQRAARSLSLYTCGSIKIREGRHLSRELVARGFLTAAKVARALGEDPQGAFAFYILYGWQDYESFEEGIVRPAVQARIDKMFGLLKSMGFYSGYPRGADVEGDSFGAVQITLAELETNFREQYWQWAYVDRFGAFASCLDKEELQLRFAHREAEDWKVIEQKIKHWKGEDGASQKLDDSAVSTQDLLSILEDRELNFDLGERAFVLFMQKGDFSREAMIRVVNVFKKSVFDPSEYPDQQLRRSFFNHLPDQFQTAALRGKLGLTS